MKQLARTLRVCFRLAVRQKARLGGGCCRLGQWWFWRRGTRPYLAVRHDGECFASGWQSEKKRSWEDDSNSWNSTGWASKKPCRDFKARRSTQKYGSALLPIFLAPRRVSAGEVAPAASTTGLTRGSEMPRRGAILAPSESNVWVRLHRI